METDKEQFDRLKREKRRAAKLKHNRNKEWKQLLEHAWIRKLKKNYQGE